MDVHSFKTSVEHPEWAGTGLVEEADRAQVVWSCSKEAGAQSRAGAGLGEDIPCQQPH